MTTTEESTLCCLAPEVAAKPRFCTENFHHEKTVVTLDSFSEKVSAISTIVSSGSSLGVHVMGSTISSNSWLLESTHGISKEIAHFTCQFVHETQIDVEIKQHLYCDIRESRVHFECEWLPQPSKLARKTHFADWRRIFKSFCLSDSLTCVYACICIWMRMCVYDIAWHVEA